MSRSPFGPAADRPTPPDAVPGAFVGPGGPHDRNAVVIDARHALMLEHVDVSRAELGGLERATGAFTSRQGYVVELEGVRGREGPAGGPRLVIESHRRGRLVLLQEADGLAALLTETMAIYARHDLTLFRVAVEEVEKRLRALGDTPPRRYTDAPLDLGSVLQADELEVTLLTKGAGEPDLAPPIGWAFTGRINRSSRRATNVVLANPRTAIELLARIMQVCHDDEATTAAVAARLAALEADGTLPRRRDR